MPRVVGASWLTIIDTQLRCREAFLASSGGYDECTVEYTLGFALPPGTRWNISYDCRIELSTVAPGDIIPVRVRSGVYGILPMRSSYATDFGLKIISVRRMLAENPFRVRLTGFDCDARREAAE